MNTIVPPSPATDANALDHMEVCAVFVLDAGGSVVATNRSARLLWAASDKSLIGLPFARLFGAADASPEPESAAAQWKALSAAMLDASVLQTTQPLQGRPRDVRVRLERALGGAGTYIAVAQAQPVR